MNTRRLLKAQSAVLCALLLGLSWSAAPAQSIWPTSQSRWSCPSRREAWPTPWPAGRRSAGRATEAAGRYREQGGRGRRARHGAGREAEPDGYTLLLAVVDLHLPEADKLLGRTAYQVNDLKPIARFTADPTVLVVRADSPWKTSQSSSPTRRQRRARSTSAHPATTARCTCRWRCSRRRPTWMTHIPYTGAGPAIIAARRTGRRACHRPGDARAARSTRQAARARALGRRPLGAAGRAEPEGTRSIRCIRPVVGRCSCRPTRPTTSSQRLRDAAPQGRRRSGRAADDPQEPAVRSHYHDVPAFQTYLDADAALMTEAARRIGKVE